MLQPVQRACLLLQRLLEVRHQDVRILDRLSETLDVSLDQVTKLFKSFQLVILCLPVRLIIGTTDIFLVDCSVNIQLIQNCNAVVKVRALREKCRELSLSRHRSILDKCEVFSDLFHLVLDFFDLLSNVVVVNCAHFFLRYVGSYYLWLLAYFQDGLNFMTIKI